MLEAANRVVIARPTRDVFALLANSENDPQWRRGVVEIKRMSGEGAGARYHQVVRGPAGRSVVADIEITDYRQDQLIGFRTLTGPVRPVGRYELSPDGLGTAVSFTLTAELGGLKRLIMGRVVRRTMEAEVGALGELKRILESGGA
ncbi:MAG: SRPBCC family protein [Candidatus Dormiibacterota bacterium]